jgi:hypothetical protein
MTIAADPWKRPAISGATLQECTKAARAVRQSLEEMVP